ncbi:MAG: DUF4058 family protein, partial [Planctomycetaceae bacterium]
MPSPFPGMDPWIESPSEWTGFHDILIVKTIEVLQPQLRARGYYANPGDRVWLTEPRRPIYPDVAVIRRTRLKGRADAGVAVADPDEPVRIQQAQIEIRESFIEIFDAIGNRLV